MSTAIERPPPEQLAIDSPVYMAEEQLDAAAGSGGESAPLLYYVEGCPGCGVERRKAANAGVPYGSFIYVWVVTLCTGTHSIIAGLLASSSIPPTL